ncbi:MAG: putative transporter [Bacteroidales bacterium]|nr:putative transporter [Bacteroidales bacterium]
MNWFTELFTQQTFTQAVMVLSLICASGLALGNIKIFGISLGVAFVFFAGIIAGHFGIEIDPEMLAFGQNFGLILYIYALGLQVGPGFFSSFKQGGIKLNVISFLVLIVGSVLAVAIHFVAKVSLPDSVGLLAGAVTNTPMLGAAQQTLLQMNPEGVQEANSMAMACAVAYPFGIIGMILSVMIMRALFAPKKASNKEDRSADNTFVTEYQISNPGIFGKTIQEVRKSASVQFVISRVWKDGKVMIPTSDTILEQGEHIMVISSKNDVERIKTLFGHQEDVDWNKKGIDWNAIDSQLVSRKILVTKNEHNGVKLGDLKLRNSYGINITRVNRAGIDLLPSRNLRLQFGDKLTIVGEGRSVDNVEAVLGNEKKRLNTPNLLSIFIGIILGIILGSIPLKFPGMTMPVKLGIAGGPVIVGIIMGAFGPRFHIATYTTQSANLMLRQLGLTIFLAGLGLSAGKGFFDAVFSLVGLKWVVISVVLAMIPVLLVGILTAKFFKTGYADNVGMLCGSMANPFALEFAGESPDGEDPAVAYATVYPASIFLRVISAQLIMILFG